MTNFFLKFMETDQLGRIAVLQRFLVDQEVLDTSDPKWLTTRQSRRTPSVSRALPRLISSPHNRTRAYTINHIF